MKRVVHRLLAVVLAGTVAPWAGAAVGAEERPRAEKVVLDERAGPFRRSYRVFVPEATDGPIPLVVALHGGVATGRIFERQTGFTELAAREGFAVVYPNGLGIFSLFRHWNGGFCCAKAARSGLDDRGFLDRVIERLSDRHPIDPERIYVVGYSNGGFLAYWYAATRAERVAGLGIWASSIGRREGDRRIADWEMPRPSAPVPAFVAHGTEDPRLPWEAPRERKGTETVLGAVGSAAFWARANGCAEGPRVEQEPTGIEWRRWCDGDPESGPPPVALVGLEGQGHDWPAFGAGDPRESFDLATEMWRFFERTGR